MGMSRAPSCVLYHLYCCDKSISVDIHLKILKRKENVSLLEIHLKKK